MGKSTLLMQALGRIAARGARCLLVCAEESTAQVRMRADRLGALAPELFVVSETSLPAVVAYVATLRARRARDRLDPGRARSRRARARPARSRRCATARRSSSGSPRSTTSRPLLVGHVTKDGALAGPRALEHVVDTVLSFEGDRHHALRMLRALKHRFGATDELGLMEMTERRVCSRSTIRARCSSPTGASARPARSSPRCSRARGRCASRCRRSWRPRGAPMPRRVAQAFEGNRLAMLVAVLQQRAGIALGDQDVYASVAGGVRVAEPAADLAVALAIVGRARTTARSTPTRSSSASSGSAARSARCRRRRAGWPRRCGSGSGPAIVPLSTPDVPRDEARSGSATSARRWSRPASGAG